MAKHLSDTTSGSHLPFWSLTLPSWAESPGSTADLRSRLRARLRQRTLDREIASGLLDGDPARALRARQLADDSERWSVAACLANILDAADERHADPASVLKLNHAEVLAARHEIVSLIEALRSPRSVQPRGVALARTLTDDRGSPLLVERAGRTVRQAVCEAAAALNHAIDA